MNIVVKQHYLFYEHIIIQQSLSSIAHLYNFVQQKLRYKIIDQKIDKNGYVLTSNLQIFFSG